MAYDKNNSKDNRQRQEFDKGNSHRLHYQVFLQEDRPTQPKDEEEIEY